MSLIVGAGTVPLNVQVLTVFPGAISISASSATSVICLLGTGASSLFIGVKVLFSDEAFTA